MDQNPSRIQKPRPLHRCPTCLKSFTKRSNMLIHARLHTGETPYVCKYAGCGRSYKWLSSINFHESRCDKRFAGLAVPAPRPPPPPAAAEAARIAAAHAEAANAAFSNVPTSVLTSDSVHSAAGPSDMNRNPLTEPLPSQFAMQQPNFPTDLRSSSQRSRALPYNQHFLGDSAQQDAQYLSNHMLMKDFPQPHSGSSQSNAAVHPIHPPITSSTYQSLPSYHSLQRSAERHQSDQSPSNFLRRPLLQPPASQRHQRQEDSVHVSSSNQIENLHEYHSSFQLSDNLSSHGIQISHPLGLSSVSSGPHQGHASSTLTSQLDSSRIRGALHMTPDEVEPRNLHPPQFHSYDESDQLHLFHSGVNTLNPSLGLPSSGPSYTSFGQNTIDSVGAYDIATSAATQSYYRTSTGMVYVSRPPNVGGNNHSTQYPSSAAEASTLFSGDQETHHPSQFSRPH